MSIWQLGQVGGSNCSSERLNDSTMRRGLLRYGMLFKRWMPLKCACRMAAQLSQRDRTFTTTNAGANERWRLTLDQFCRTAFTIKAGDIGGCPAPFERPSGGSDMELIFHARGGPLDQVSNCAGR